METLQDKHEKAIIAKEGFTDFAFYAAQECTRISLQFTVDVLKEILFATEKVSIQHTVINNKISELEKQIQELQ